MIPRLLERYRGDLHTKLKGELGFGNPHQVPTLSKIVVNVGLGERYELVFEYGFNFDDVMLLNVGGTVRF